MVRVRWLARLSLLLVTSCADSLGPCDIRDSSCQEDVFLAVRDVRGSGWDPWLTMPPVRVISEADYLSELVAEALERPAPTPDERAYEGALKLLGMLHPSFSLAGAQNSQSRQAVAAYYSTVDKNITVIDRAERMDPEGDVATLAHELVHAAQDAERDIPAFLSQASSFEEYLALLTLIEGEAVLYSLLAATLPMASMTPKDVDWYRTLADYLGAVQTQVQRSPSPVVAAPLLVYPLGARLFVDTWRVSGSVGTRSLFDAAPRTMQNLMVDLEGLPNSTHPVTVTPGCAAPEAPPGYQHMGSDTFGAAILYALTTRLGDQAWAWRAASQWSADRYSLFRKDTSAYLVWQIKMLTTTGASNLASSVRFQNVSAQAFGSDVVIVAANDLALLIDHPPACR